MKQSRENDQKPLIWGQKGVLQVPNWFRSMGAGEGGGVARLFPSRLSRLSALSRLRGWCLLSRLQ